MVCNASLLPYNKLAEEEVQIPAESMPVPVANDENRDISKMVWDDKMNAYYDVTGYSFSNEDGTEFSPF